MGSDNSKKWLDNRDIRDKKYVGDLVIESVEGFSKEEAMSKMKSILERDVEHFEISIEDLENRISFLKERKELAENRLKEF